MSDAKPPTLPGMPVPKCSFQGEGRAWRWVVSQAHLPVRGAHGGAGRAASMQAWGAVPVQTTAEAQPESDTKKYAGSSSRAFEKT